MTTMHADHDRDELPGIWQSDIVWKREHLLEGCIAPIPIETLERARKVPRNSDYCGSAGSEVEIHRREALRPSADR